MLERFGHGGDLRTAEDIYGHRNKWLDFSANMNPFGPPVMVREIMRKHWREIAHYPDPEVRELRSKLAERYQIPPESILVGNGAAELIDLAVRTLHPAKTAVIRPSFSEYEEAVHKIGGEVLPIPLFESDGFRLKHTEELANAASAADCLLLGHPNNPTGALIESALLDDLLAESRMLMLDEAFMDFIADEASHSFIRRAAESRKLIVFRSMTKFFAIPGIRLGFLVAHPDFILRLKKLQVHWSVNFLAQRIGTAVLEDHAYADRTHKWLMTERAWLVSALRGIGLQVIPSETNFLLFSMPSNSGWVASALQKHAAKQGILLRDASLFPGLGGTYCRIAVRKRHENKQLVEVLQDAFMLKAQE